MPRPVFVQICRLSAPYATEDGETARDVLEFVYDGAPQPLAEAVAAAVAHVPAGRMWSVRDQKLHSRDEDGTTWAIVAVTVISEDDTEGMLTDDEYYGPARAIHAALAA